MKKSTWIKILSGAAMLVGFVCEAVQQHTEIEEEVNSQLTALLSNSDSDDDDEDDED